MNLAIIYYKSILVFRANRSLRLRKQRVAIFAEWRLMMFTQWV
jgi:hypothetical protein